MTVMCIKSCSREELALSLSFMMIHLGMPFNSQKYRGKSELVLDKKLCYNSNCITGAGELSAFYKSYFK